MLQISRYIAKSSEKIPEFLEISDKSFYRSTYSLVSPTRIENTDFEELERIENQEKTQDDS